MRRRNRNVGTWRWPGVSLRNWRAVKAPDQPPEYDYREICPRCMAAGELRHRPCFRPGCHCKCSRVKGRFA